MLPLVQLAGDKAEHSLRETIETLASEFKLTEQERQELLPSGQQEIFANRVGWARTYLKKAGLIETTRRGFFKITERGLGVLKQKPAQINSKFLTQFEEFRAFQARREPNESSVEEIEQPGTPQEALEQA